MQITRLGQGVDATHRLKDEAVERTLAVLAGYRQAMDEFGVGRCRLVATSAVRDAENGGDFLSAATTAVGVTAELLSGEEEGRLSYTGATADIEMNEGDDLVIDIGGGSTEIVLRRDSSLETISLDIGCVRITERFLHSDPPTVNELQGAEARIAHELERAAKDIPSLTRLRDPRRLLGLAGTVSTLAALELGLVDYERERIHHSVLTLSAVEHWARVLALEPTSVRGRRAAISAGREDVIVGGAMVLQMAMSRFGFDRCIVSESDILDGIAASLLS